MCCTLEYQAVCKDGSSYVGSIEKAATNEDQSVRVVKDINCSNSTFLTVDDFKYIRYYSM